MTITTISAQEKDQFKQNTVLREVADHLSRFMNAEVSVAAASTTSIGSARAVLLNVTGSTTITSFDNTKAGIWRILRFSSNPVLTFNSTSLTTPTGASITTAAGGTALVEAQGGLNWRIYAYWPPDTLSSAQAGITLLNTIVASNQATIVDSTSFTSNFTFYKIILSDLVPVNDSVNARLRVNVGGIQTTSYVATSLVTQFSTAGSGVASTSSSIPLTYPGSTAVNTWRNDSTLGISGEVSIYNPSGTTSRKKIRAELAYGFSSTDGLQVLSGGYYNGGNGAVTGIEISADSGSVASGTVKIYGIK